MADDDDDNNSDDGETGGDLGDDQNSEEPSEEESDPDPEGEEAANDDSSIDESDSEDQNADEADSDDQNTEGANPEDQNAEDANPDDQNAEDANPDDQNAEDANPEDQNTGSSIGGDGGDGGEGGDGEMAGDNSFDPPEVDSDVLGSRDEYPAAEAEDFHDDAGDWSVDDYLDTAPKLFGDHEFFGDTAHQRYSDAGFALLDNHEEWSNTIAQYHPDAADSVRFYHKDNQVVPLGFVTTAALAILQQVFPQIDLSALHVTLPANPEEPRRTPGELPPELQNVNPADKVDLRKHATPIGDQGQTSRCAAFAWTHAIELSGNVIGHPTPPLSCSYTMLQFQKKQGDFKDYHWAYKGGDGTGAEAEPGRTLAMNGTCRHDLWPNDHKEPLVGEDEMASDARSYPLPADVSVIAIDDVKKVLTSGCPVVLAMNTGSAFSELGRDGVVHAAEEPHGRHGRHAMLIVGYVSNYFIVKNSWGTDWGDQGYCYIPKIVLGAADPEFEAVLLNRRGAVVSSAAPAGDARGQGGKPARELAAAGPPPLSPPSFAAPPAPPAPRGFAAIPDYVPPPSSSVAPLPSPALVRCSSCGNNVKAGRFCASCGKPLAPPPELPRYCHQCGSSLPAGAHFCRGCGSRFG